MKKAFLLLAACAFATASYAQTGTDVKVRDNGTKVITTKRADGSTTVTTTGKTNVGAAIDNTADAAGNEAKKVGHKVSNTFHKGAKKTKNASYRASSKLRKSTKKMEANSAQ